MENIEANSELESRTSTRRGFFVNAFMGSSLIAGLGFMAFYFLGFLFPTLKAKPRRKLYVGKASDIPPGHNLGFTDLKGQKISIVNTGEGYTALSTKCTHLGCQVFWKKNKKQFYCPCHEGYFDAQGKVLKGPPPKPLNSYPVEVVDGAVYIYVDEVYVG